MSGPLGVLLDPLALPFMRNGLAQVALLAVASGLIGVFVVQRSLTFFAHAISHTLFPALVIAAILRVDAIVGALVGAATTTALVIGLRRRRDVAEDSAVGIVFVGLVGLGVVLVGLFRVRARDVGAAVVGNLLGVSTADLLLSAALVAVLGVTVALLYRPLVLLAFDPVFARVLGLPIGRLEALLVVLVAATVVVSVQAVGIVLTVAVLVAPAATARFWTRRLPRLMLLATGIGMAAGGLGLYVAYYQPIAPAAVIVLALASAFLASAALGSTRRRAH